MLKKLSLFILLLSISFISTNAQTVQNTDNVIVLPFENTSGKPEFNWVGESFADSLSDLLRVPSLNVVGNDERKVIQQRLNVPLTTLPSLATSLKLSRESKATLLISGRYNIIPAQGDIAASLTVTAKIIRVNEGRFLSEELPDGRKITRDITLSDALANLQTVEGQLAYQILYQRDKALPFSQNQFVDSANKVPAKAFEAYIKGLLTVEADPKREIFLKNAMRLYAETKEGETYTDAALELGHFYLNQRKTTEAIDFFSRIPQTDQHFPEAAFYTGLTYWANNSYEQALAVMRPLADELKLTGVYNALGAIAVQAARVEKKNKPKSAELLREGTEYLKKASDSQPDDPEARFNYGLALFADGKFAEAIKQIQPVLASNPRDGEAYFLLAKSLEKTADASAADFDNQARRFLSNYAKVETEYRRGNATDGILLRVEQPPRKDFVGVVMIKNQNPTIKPATNETGDLLAQAKQLYKNGRDDESMAILRKVLNSEPMSSEAYLMLGKIHLRRTDMEQATSSLKTSLFWDNSQIEAYILLTRIFVEKKDCLTAKNYAEAAIKIDGENQEVTGLQRLVERCGK